MLVVARAVHCCRLGVMTGCCLDDLGSLLFYIRSGSLLFDSHHNLCSFKILVMVMDQASKVGVSDGFVKDRGTCINFVRSDTSCSRKYYHLFTVHVFFSQHTAPTTTDIYHLLTHQSNNRRRRQFVPLHLQPQ